MTVEMPIPTDLSRLLRPRGVAVIGASNDPNKIGGRPIDYLRRYGFEGAIYPINREHAAVQGLKAYERLEDAPGKIDLAIVAVPAAGVRDALGDCGRRHIPFAIVFTSGFAESGAEGAESQRDLQEIARRAGVRLLGPNSLGVISEPARLTATFSTVLDRPSGLIAGESAFISQSGAFGSLFYAIAKDEGVGFRHFVSVGNEADLGVADFISSFVSDPQTRAIGGYLEGLRDVAGFRRCAQEALAQGKPLAFIKVGASETGQRAARSHTGAVAGTDAIYDGLFRQWGILRFTEMQDLLGFLSLARTGRFPDSNRVGVLSISGGVGVWLADRCSDLGLALPPLDTRTREGLGRVLPAFAAIENPVDFTGQIVNQPDLLAAATRHMLDDPGFDALVIVMGLLERTGERIAMDLARVLSESNKLVAVTWISGPAAAYRVLQERGVPVFADVSRCIRAVASMAEYGRVHRQYEARKQDAGSLVPRIAPGPSSDWGATEFDAKKVLRSHGFQVPPGGMARTVQQAMEVAQRAGYPVALKVQLKLCPHKTDHGLVELNVATQSELAAAYEQLMLRFKAAFGLDVPEGILVERMSAGVVEVIVGCTRDPNLGPVVMVGLGGTQVEVYRDVVFRLAPIAPAEARDMLAQLRGKRMFEGFRGRPPADLTALAEAISRLSALFCAADESLSELEINPVAVMPSGQGICVLDALVTRNRP